MAVETHASDGACAQCARCSRPFAKPADARAQFKIYCSDRCARAASALRRLRRLRAKKVQAGWVPAKRGRKPRPRSCRRCGASLPSRGESGRDLSFCDGCRYASRRTGRTLYERDCQGCGVKFAKPERTARFCSMRCAGRAIGDLLRARAAAACAYRCARCSKEFYRRRRDGRTPKYCSRDCSLSAQRRGPTGAAIITLRKHFWHVTRVKTGRRPQGAYVAPTIP